MHSLNVVTLFAVLTMVGVEFSVSAFEHPSAWRLDHAPQSRMLSHFAAILGKVMPFWYASGLILLGMETWLNRHTTGFAILLTVSAIWTATTLATIFFLVPLNKLVVEGGAGWQEANRTWDRRHRARIVVLAVASFLLTYVVVC